MDITEQDELNALRHVCEAVAEFYGCEVADILNERCFGDVLRHRNTAIMLASFHFIGPGPTARFFGINDAQVKFIEDDMREKADFNHNYASDLIDLEARLENMGDAIYE